MEVICSGLNVVDVLVLVPDHAKRGSKTQSNQIVLQGGAPAGNAACGLAALGHETAFLGHFGNNALSQTAKTELQKWGVSNLLFLDQRDAFPAIAVVEIDSHGERTVYYSLNQYVPIHPDEFTEAQLGDARLILVDAYDVEINTHLLHLAKQKGIYSVLDMELGDRKHMLEMIKLASDAILSLEAAQFLTGKQNMEECAIALSALTSATTVITDGENGSISYFQNQLIKQKAYPVNVVDTTGCGDAFHAAYASALLQGFNLPKRLRYASYFASQVASVFGGRTAFLTREQVLAKIKSEE